MSGYERRRLKQVAAAAVAGKLLLRFRSIESLFSLSLFDFVTIGQSHNCSRLGGGTLPMSKSALNELCQRQRWPAPVYSTTRYGSDHAPRFHATVTVNGTAFASESEAKSVKDAQADAARVAFQQFSAAAAQAPPPPLLGIKHMYKSKLQIYAQRRNLLLPEYAVERDGPVHASRFSCSVTLGGQTYRSEGFLPTLKDAENSAAKVALAELQPDGTGEEEAIYKSLLQERAQRGGGLLPVYDTRIVGRGHSPIFISTVALEGQVFHGLEAKSKKLAETSAAKVAYTSLTQGNSIRTTVQEPVLPAPNNGSARLTQHQYVPPQPSMPSKQKGIYMGSSSGTKTLQPLNSILFEHLHQHIQNELKGDQSFITNPGFDSNSATFQLSAPPMATQPLTNLNEMITAKPPTIPSSSYRNELTTGTQPSIIQPCSGFDSILVNPAAFPPVGPVSMPVAPAPTSEGITSRVQHLIGTSIQQGDRIVVHSRNVSVTYPNGSDVLPISDNYWVAVRGPVSQPPSENEQA
ncbi:Double-stranded RNA-binding protein 4 [Linum grandiflorum]